MHVDVDVAVYQCRNPTTPPPLLLPPGPLAQPCKVCKESRDKSCAEDDQLLVISAPLHVGPTASGEAALF